MMKVATEPVALRRLVAVAAVVLCLSSGGCAVLLVGAGAAAGAGLVAYVKGELKATEAVSLDVAWAATLKAMEQLEFAVTQKSKDRVSAQVVARGAADRKIQITLQGRSEKVTEIRIRVDFLGDEALSRRILEEIKKNWKN